MTIDLTQIFQAIIALLAALITTKLIPWIKARTTEKQQQNLKIAVDLVVYAAEQLYGAGQGEEKLQYCLDKLEAVGYHLDKTLLREAIESAVYDMNQFNGSQEEEPEEDPPAVHEDPAEDLPEEADQ